MEAKEAFEALRNIAADELEKVRQKGEDYSARGETGRVREMASRAGRIQTAQKAVLDLQQLWGQILPAALPPIAPPLEIPDQQIPAGQRTPRGRFWLPILQALVEMNGEAQTAQVLDRVGELMGSILSDYDCQRLHGRRDIRWRSTAHWARCDMVQAGYMRGQTPRGTWEITEEGRKYLENRVGKKDKEI